MLANFHHHKNFQNPAGISTTFVLAKARRLASTIVVSQAWHCGAPRRDVNAEPRDRKWEFSSRLRGRVGVGQHEQVNPPHWPSHSTLFTRKITIWLKRKFPRNGSWAYCSVASNIREAQNAGCGSEQTVRIGRAEFFRRPAKKEGQNVSANKENAGIKKSQKLNSRARQRTAPLTNPASFPQTAADTTAHALINARSSDGALNFLRRSTGKCFPPTRDRAEWVTPRRLSKNRTYLLIV